MDLREIVCEGTERIQVARDDQLGDYTSQKGPFHRTAVLYLAVRNNTALWV
jgi:hypothetical protein